MQPSPPTKTTNQILASFTAPENKITVFQITEPFVKLF
ncbi:Uncharacterized protein dnm_012610 [Desulfonema magnum]|uniref:Uncharacterized protein n=1 Tax=Desulfonema magnum TaxID=45655 RepID=A0A975GKX9_9BACT|nr:Uncharacterized protein dnm_012610 [Desulfonema magnum]